MYPGSTWFIKDLLLKGKSKGNSRPLAAKNDLASHVAKVGVDSVPIPEFAVHHDPFF